MLAEKENRQKQYCSGMARKWHGNEICEINKYSTKNFVHDDFFDSLVRIEIDKSSMLHSTT